MKPDALPEHWRTRADDLARYGATQAAETCRVLAAELEGALREQAGEPLTLTEASAESRYSERRLRELLASGEIPNAGAPGRPRIRRGDLPRRARSRNGSTYDAGADAGRLLDLMEGSDAA